MTTKAKKVLQLLTLALFFTLPIVAQSLPEDPGEDPDGPVDVPLDGGLSLLLAAGVGYLAKKGFNGSKVTATYRSRC